MNLRDRRKARGYSQEKIAALIGVDRTTVGRWERGETEPQPEYRSKLAAALHVDLVTLDALIKESSASPEPDAGSPSHNAYDAGEDDMIRREFLRVLAVAGALAALSVEEDALADDADRDDPAGYLRMNGHLWQVYQLARSKGSVQPVVSEQLAALSESLSDRPSPLGPSVWRLVTSSSSQVSWRSTATGTRMPPRRTRSRLRQAGRPGRSTCGPAR